ncbi:hypothetical protein NQ314_005544 [Rhamnusium bicolor]|uniref:Uncharacterized protein n=1 Tax=Rhamnusium bicolor TaxID=1586634 RepID=A0AAV8ZGA1_9CUCU|nr:hypothetical protein NQ314_005544 [Rhamnusium bicolor]
MVAQQQSERNIGNSKFYMGDSKKDLTLEDYFFELEQQMENNLVCRDHICRNVDIEKGNNILPFLSLCKSTLLEFFTRNCGNITIYFVTR